MSEKNNAFWEQLWSNIVSRAEECGKCDPSANYNELKLKECFYGLTEQQKDILRLRIIDKAPLTLVAERMNISTSASRKIETKTYLEIYFATMCTKDEQFWITLQNELAELHEKNGKTGRHKLNYGKSELQKAFYALDFCNRDILTKRFRDGLSISAIQTAMAISKRTVIRRQKSALLALYGALPEGRLFCTDPNEQLVKTACEDESNIEDVLRTLSPGIIQRLRKHNYCTMRQLCAATTRELLSIDGLGDKSVQKIIGAVWVYAEWNLTPNS